MSKINYQEWESVIGLEIHAQINTNSKLFSGAKNIFGAEPNSEVDIFDCALPGTLPVLNKAAIEHAVRTGLAINGTINKYSAFDRKHYFYPDLPSGYQISQFYYPIVTNGKIEIEIEDGNKKIINVERIHIEQDAGKTIHDLSPKYSYIDLNRSGVPLMEIVSKPEISSAEEAIEYIKNLQMIMQYVGSCDGNMEKGNLRCDANISVRKKGDPKLGTRCEVKNLNSTSNILQAINFEIKRQIDILESGGEIEQQTRLFDANLCETRKLRGKEEAMDYKYFPDPDLLPVHLEDEYIDNIAKTLPKLPHQRKAHYQQLNLGHEFIKTMIADFAMGEYFEEVLLNNDFELCPLLCSNWVNIEMLGRLNKRGIFCFSDSPIKPIQLAGLLKTIKSQLINAKIAKEVLDKMFEENLDAEYIIERDKLAQVIDYDAIRAVIKEVLQNNLSQVESYKNGKVQLYGYFVGQVMKKGQGKFNPDAVNEMLREEIDKI